MQTTIPGGAESTTDGESFVANVHIGSSRAGLLRNRNIRHDRTGKRRKVCRSQSTSETRCVAGSSL